MKAAKMSSLMVVLFLIAGFSMFLGYTGAAFAQTKPVLKNDDCVKCHTSQPADIAAAGAKHKDLGCLGCHEGHPPLAKKGLPQCNQCHMGSAHYELKGCLNCHKDPHTPLNISFGSNVTDACLTCHSQQITQLRDHKSKHTNLACSTCHNVHGKVPQCTQCHKPHSTEMVADDCSKCHKAHMPKNVTYAADVPSKDCGACHQKAVQLLSTSKAKHKPLACAYCHQEKHKMVPACQDCHGSPHPAGLLSKFPKCGECHSTAHDLNNWSAAKAKEAPKEAPKKK
jgi:hypothetical protein